MQRSIGALLLTVACTLPYSVAADESVTLESLRWKYRVLLVPAVGDGPSRVNWSSVSDALRERDLMVFEEVDGTFRTWFPEPSTKTTLKLPRSTHGRVHGRVTLIGKDGEIKRHWQPDSAELPAAVFALIDSMPMRQREMREKASVSGDGLIGTRAPEWSAGPEWANSKPLRLEDLRGRVVVVRFWTDTCPYCEASLPAMQKLADEFAAERVTFVGLYQSKPYGSERPWRAAVGRAKELGVRFPIAYDHEWKTLNSWWLAGGRRRATSASFVVGADGTFVHVHPGPVFFPSQRPEDARANGDFEAIRAAILSALRSEN